MSDYMPPSLQCSTCIRTSATVNRGLLAEWQAQSYAKSQCPVCVGRWLGSARPERNLQCAGCSRRAKLKGHVCSSCAELGVKVQPLF